jgi:hypothetical protein
MEVKSKEPDELNESDRDYKKKNLYLNSDHIFDKKELNLNSVIVVLIIIFSAWRLDNAFYQEYLAVYDTSESIGLGLIISILQLMMQAYRLISPLLVIAVISFYPLFQASPYRCRLSTWGLESFLEPAYRVMIKPAKVAWYDITSAKVVEFKKDKYIQLFNEYESKVAAINLTKINLDKFLNSLVLFVDQEHALYHLVMNLTKKGNESE